MAIHAFDSAQFAQFVRFANNPKTIELVPPDEPGTVFMLTAATPAIHELAAQL